MNRLSLLVAAPLALAMAGCSSFYAEADQPEVCLTVPNQTFNIPGGGIVAPPGGFTGTFTGTVDVGINGTLPDILVNGSPDDHVLQLLTISATLVNSGVSFDWLQNLTFKVNDTTPIAYYGGGLPPGTRSFTLATNNPGLNLLTTLQAGKLNVTMQGSVFVPEGSPVPSQWTASINACLSAHVKQTLDQLINGK